MPFYHLTTRLKGDPDQALLRKVGGRGFPTLVVMAPDGSVLATHSGARTPAAFEETLRQAQSQYVRPTGRASADAEKLSPMERLIRDVDGDRYSLEQAEKEYAKTPQQEGDDRVAQTRRVHAAFAALQLRDLEWTTATDAKSAEINRKIRTGVLAMYANGRIPSGERAWPFWERLMAAAEVAGDAELYSKALKAFRNSRGSDPARARFDAECAATLERLKE